MSKAVIVTGSYGLVGSAVCKSLSNIGYTIYGIDNDTRSRLFPELEPINDSSIPGLNESLGITKTFSVDICDFNAVEYACNQILVNYEIYAVIHCAAQPSHDWAAHDPFLDFDINARGTLNMLELLRRTSPGSLFIHLSTNKVYGDSPNYLPLLEFDSRFDLASNHTNYIGLDETLSIDQTKHSLFGCSKAAADLYVQEYRRYFALQTFVLRGGCLTGSAHRGAKLHGFLNFLVKSALSGDTYEVIGYKGKQVRDNLHASDIGTLVQKILASPMSAIQNDSYVYNLGGGRDNSISILECKSILRDSFGVRLNLSFTDEPRSGDHQWYISDLSKLKKAFNWTPSFSIIDIFNDMIG